MNNGIEIVDVSNHGNETVAVAYDSEGKELTAYIDWTVPTAYVEVNETPFDQ